MWYIVTFIAGGAVGVVFMCLFQINRQAEEEEYRINSGTANQKGGFDEKN